MALATPNCFPTELPRLGWTSNKFSCSAGKAATDGGHVAAKGFASSKVASCGGVRFGFWNSAWEQNGGTDTDEQLSNKSSTQKPGHITNGMTHVCKHTGTLPPTGTSSSRPCGAAQRGKTEEHIIPM